MAAQDRIDILQPNDVIYTLCSIDIFKLIAYTNKSLIDFFNYQYIWTPYNIEEALYPENVVCWSTQHISLILRLSSSTKLTEFDSNLDLLIRQMTAHKL
jgi:hypothetical protein